MPDSSVSRLFSWAVLESSSSRAVSELLDTGSHSVTLGNPPASATESLAYRHTYASTLSVRLPFKTLISAVSILAAMAEIRIKRLCLFIAIGDGYK